MPFLQSVQKTGYGIFSAVDPYLALTFINSVDASGTTTLTHPAGVLTGDICVLLQYGYDNDSEDFLSSNTPSGFTHLVTTPNIGTIQTSMNVSFAILPNINSVTLTQPGMDFFGHIAMYYRLGGPNLQGTSTFPGTANVVSSWTGATTTMPAAAGNISYLSFITTSSFNFESISYPSGVSMQRTQYGAAGSAFASFSIGAAYGPQPQATADGEGFDTGATYVGIASGRIGFTKSGV